MDQINSHLDSIIPELVAAEDDGAGTGGTASLRDIPSFLFLVFYDF